jgi:geranylgeranyl transferase type-2 subunit alpha
LSRNPESYTIWNYRREILENGLFVGSSNDQIQKLIEDDLRFGEKKLREYPKVYWIWNHRRWCLEKAPKPDWAHELMLVTLMLKSDQRNFHGWHYRRYVVSNIENSTGRSLVEDEFAYTTEKINADFANYSAWHNRGKLIPRYLAGKSDQERKDFLLSDLEKIRHAIYTDPEIQSSWIYQRWLLTTNDVAPSLTSEELGELIEREIKSIGELSEAEPDTKWCIDQLVWLRMRLVDVCQAPMSADVKADVQKQLQYLQTIDPMHRKRYEYLSTKVAG